MGEPIQGIGQHNRRLHGGLACEPGAEEKTPAPGLLKAPGQDGLIGDSDSDPDPADLRSEIGPYVSLATFPAEARAVLAPAEQANTTEAILANLRRLEPDARFSSPTIKGFAGSGFDMKMAADAGIAVSMGVRR